MKCPRKKAWHPTVSCSFSDFSCKFFRKNMHSQPNAHATKLLSCAAEVGQYRLRSACRPAYHFKYPRSQRSSRYIATTQLQPLDARRLLPCFDEPHFKARFALKVLHPIGTVAVANAPMKQTTEQRGHQAFVLTEFEETPKMSTYLLALAITEFPQRETKFGGIQVLRSQWTQKTKPLLCPA